jgi:SPX domain protein involved in polyphosphate accumulation
LDINIAMTKENPEDGPSCAVAGRWFRDPDFPIQRSEITRFPLAILELDLALAPGQNTPVWVQEVVESGWWTDDNILGTPA